MNWRLVIALLLLAGAIVTGWKAWTNRPEPEEAGPQEARSDFILRDFEVVSLDKQGQESFALRAPELRQTPGARTLELTTPLFLMPTEHGSRWEVNSRTGFVNETSDLIQLRGDVVANSPMGATRPTRIESDALDIFPNENRATSDAAVTITSPGTTMRGTGMEADLAGKRIQLLSKVTLNHEPTRR